MFELKGSGSARALRSPSLKTRQKSTEPESKGRWVDVWKKARTTFFSTVLWLQEHTSIVHDALMTAGEYTKDIRSMFTPRGHLNHRHPCLSRVSAQKKD